MTAVAGPSRSSAPIIIAALMLAEFTAAFELTMIYAALKTLFVVFSATATVGWLITGYLLVSAASSAICGRLGDLYGRKRVLMIVLCLAVVGSLISAFSTDLVTIIVGRAIQGFSGAILPLCFGIAREALSREKVTYGVSAIGSTAVIASAAGVMLGGVLVDSFQWHSIFYASASLALISLAVTSVLLPPSVRRPSEGKMDIAGGLIFVPAIFAILLVASNGGQWGWTNPGTVGLGLAGVALLSIWTWYELRTASPLINLRLLKNRNLLLPNLAMAFYGLGPVQGQVHALLLQQPAWTGIGAGLTATAAGLYTMPAHVTTFLMAPLTGILCTRFGAQRAVAAGTIFLLASWLMILAFPSSLLMLVVSGPVMAIGTTTIYSSIPNLVVAASPDANIAESTSVTQVLRSTSQAVGAQILGMLLATATVTNADHPGTFPAPSAIVWAIVYISGACAAMALTALLLLSRAKAAPCAETPVAGFEDIEGSDGRLRTGQA